MFSDIVGYTAMMGRDEQKGDGRARYFTLRVTESSESKELRLRC